MPIVWIGRDARYGEKLATPDVSIADLIGEIDPIKVAEGRYLADEETIHYGLVPRTNRGLFAINELPDLTEKVQVGLFNLMEEKDVQIKGYKIRLPLDVVIVASANPEDYTSRGRIITPLKDRFDVQIRTHYPRTLDARDRHHGAGAAGRSTAATAPCACRDFLKEIIAQVTFEARACAEINQASGVSVRVTINNYESVLSNAEKRAVRIGETRDRAAPQRPARAARLDRRQDRARVRRRGEEGGRPHRAPAQPRRAQGLRQASSKIDDLTPVIAHFEAGWGVEVSRRDARRRSTSKGVRADPRPARGRPPPRRRREPRLHRRRHRVRSSRACTCTRSSTGRRRDALELQGLAAVNAG